MGTNPDNYIHVDVASVLVALSGPAINAGRVIHISHSRQNEAVSIASDSDSSGFTTI